MNRSQRRNMHVVGKNDNEAMAAIDPAVALELLPQKITDRKRVIQEILLELSVAREVDPSVDLTPWESQLAQHRRFLTVYEERLEAIKRAVNGG